MFEGGWTSTNILNGLLKVNGVAVPTSNEAFPLL